MCRLRRTRTRTRVRARLSEPSLHDHDRSRVSRAVRARDSHHRQQRRAAAVVLDAASRSSRASPPPRTSSTTTTRTAFSTFSTSSSSSHRPYVVLVIARVVECERVGRHILASTPRAGPRGGGASSIDRVSLARVRSVSCPRASARLIASSTRTSASSSSRDRALRATVVALVALAAAVVAPPGSRRARAPDVSVEQTTRETTVLARGERSARWVTAALLFGELTKTRTFTLYDLSPEEVLKFGNGRDFWTSAPKSAKVVQHNHESHRF